MRKVLQIALMLVMGVGTADAAVRDANSVTRSAATTSIPRTATAPQRTGDIRARTGTSKNTTRNARAASTKSVTARSAKTNTVARAAVPTTKRATISGTKSRNIATSGPAKKSTARATITMNTIQSNTFGTGYNTCRDAYFTCMDQFCGTANDTYRRCICSSKLGEVQSRERALSQAGNQLQDFQDLNLAVINKTSAEVQAMLSASSGELTQSVVKDNSGAAQQLAGISDVLSKTKTKSLSTQGTLDIAGDINSIWSTTDLAGGVNIANLTGEALYNAVHSQCTELTADRCPDKTTQNMVISAYGMYIEKDCSLVINNLDKKLTTANSTIRANEREMHLARLENYNAHNSTSINDCIARVRADITTDTACGTDYVHCLDITGLYLSYDTGEPIYTPNFYQLESQVSLSGDILKNQTNRILIAKLESMRPYASGSLDTCRDLADDVWNEFLRQAITEIYQGQHERIRMVKNDCLDVVNQCYDEQTQSLKDFSNTDDQLMIGARLELAEQMCQEKLNACANLYGGGSHGMQALLTAMHNITDQQIGMQCHDTLTKYVKNMCAVPGNDTIHIYPYACRVYAPGEQTYATILQCNIDTTATINENLLAGGGISTNGTAVHTKADYAEDPENPAGAQRPDEQVDDNYKCQKIYSSCPSGSYMAGPSGTDYNGTPMAGNTCIVGKNTDYCQYTGGTAAPSCAYTGCAKGYYLSYNGAHNSKATVGNSCEPCPSGYFCNGGIDAPAPNNDTTTDDTCGTDYIGSLYQKLVRYAMQTCVRPTESTNILPAHILQDVNMVMTETRTEMSHALSQECERLGGIWVDSPWVDEKGKTVTGTNGTTTETADNKHDATGQTLHTKFYSETSANTQWGFCATIDANTTITSTSQPNSDNTPAPPPQEDEENSTT